MITYVAGDIFQSPARVLVNPVNTAGVMSRGLAADFKRFYPPMFDEYKTLCDDNRLDVGQLWLYRSAHKWILNFPTKKHWRSNSKVDFIDLGLRKFVAIYAEQGFTSVSFPKLGSGLGNLDWETDVRPLMESYLAPLPIQVYIHEADAQTIASRNTRAVASWLRGVPQSVTFDKFWRDLNRQVKRQPVYQALDGSTGFRAEPELRGHIRNLVIQPRSGPMVYLSQTLLDDLWAYITGAGYALPDNLPGGLAEHAHFIIPVLTKLGYLHTVELTSPGGTRQIGVHYVPPVDKTPVRTESVSEVD